MYAFVGFIHVVTCVLLVITVLLQSGKGGGIASALSGQATQAVFGGRGAATFLSRGTTVLAILFMITSLTMTVMGGSQTRKSALAKQAQEEGVAAPFTPAELPPSATDEGAQPAEGVMPGATPGVVTPAGDAPQPAATQEPVATPPGGN